MMLFGTCNTWNIPSTWASNLFTKANSFGEKSLACSNFSKEQFQYFGLRYDKGCLFLNKCCLIRTT